jgi:hypothetical protein
MLAFDEDGDGPGRAGLYIGGGFTMGGSQQSQYLARWGIGSGSPPNISQEPQNASISVGQQAVLSVQVSPSISVSYQWYKIVDGVDVPLKDDERIQGASTNTLTISPAGIADSGEYFVAIMNECNVVRSELATLAVACPGSVAADLDDDCDVDNDDLVRFESCASGPAVPFSAGCEGKDLDQDGDVDQSDFGIFQRCWSGANNPPDPGCAGN